MTIEYFADVILSEAVLQAQRRACPERLTKGKESNGILRGALLLRARFLARLKSAGLRNDALQMEARGDEIE